MEFTSNEAVLRLINSYPPKAAKRLTQLRQVIQDVAQKEGVPKLLETTKWGEPSYVSKQGSTIRMDWKERTPDRCYLYFICSTELVATFKYIFGDELTFEGNRAIVLDLDDPLPKQPLMRCISLALTYHKVKHLPMLGV